MKTDFQEIVNELYLNPNKKAHLKKDAILKRLHKIWNEAVYACAESAEVKSYKNEIGNWCEMVEPQSILKNKI